MPVERVPRAFAIDPQYFAHVGFNVLQTNYRGSTGFSFAFQESIKQQGWGGAEQIDTLVTDSAADPQTVERFEEAGVRVLTV